MGIKASKGIKAISESQIQDVSYNIQFEEEPEEEKLWEVI